VVCEIGVAPVKPAEFVIFRLSQFSGGAALAE
jgi:phage tail sheath protein FI